VSVELRSVTKTYGPVRALIGVSARFEAGRVSVVTGPNGSGKSTLLGIVGTIARVTSGTIEHGEIGRSRREIRGTLGWVGHDSLCYPELTGRENIEIAARLHGTDPKEAFDRVAARFELGAYCERPVRTYSRGQRQRLSLARALVHRPRLLLLDEPTTGLDAGSMVRLCDVVREEAASQAIVVVVTHDAPFATAVADVRIALERGRVVRGDDPPSS
jgi:ABC-type multidrug transport system ATPase subunit